MQNFCFFFNRSRRNATFVAAKPTINDLTATERRVLKMIADDKTSREIADQLSISVRTVERHRQNIGRRHIERWGRYRA